MKILFKINLSSLFWPFLNWKKSLIYHILFEKTGKNPIFLPYFSSKISHIFHQYGSVQRGISIFSRHPVSRFCPYNENHWLLIFLILLFCLIRLREGPMNSVSSVRPSVTQSSQNWSISFFYFWIPGLPEGSYKFTSVR